MATASSISDALVTMIGAASVFGSDNVTKDDYGVLERASACCAVVEWSDWEANPTTFGQGEFDGAWTHEIAAFAKNLGDPTEAMRNVLAVAGKVVACLQADPTIQGQVDRLDEVRASRTPREAVTIGGQTWLPVFVEVDTSTD